MAVEGRSTLRAVVYERFGEPAEVLRLEQAAATKLPAAGEVLVRVRARPVNPSDLLTIRGTYAKRTPLPAVPGWEGVGEVVALGAGAAGLAKGMRVLPLEGGGTWQELVTAPAARCVVVPPSIGDDQACQLMINPLTAWLIVTEVLGLGPGDIVVANAAGSAFVRILAQLAAMIGFRLIALVRGEAHHAALTALGVADVIDTTRTPVAEAVRDLTGGAGAFAALDAVGGADGLALARCLAPGGTLVSYGLLSGQLLPPEAASLLPPGARRVDYWLRHWVEHATLDERRAAFAAVIDLVSHGRLALEVAEHYDLAEVRQAVIAAERPGRQGKVVLTG